MAATTVTGVKKTTRARKTAVSSEATSTVTAPSSLKSLKAYEGVFADLLRSINETKEEFIGLQKDIDELRESWRKEQRDHEMAVLERNQQEEIAQKREKETYNYETSLARKKAEDEFAEKKAKWEKELLDRKEQIGQEKAELVLLRKQVEGFEEEKEKAVKEASLKLQKELTERFLTEKKLREQEVKSEKELMVLKITNLTQENARQTQEIVLLKKSLEEATQQLKDVAVKVIESSSSSPKIPQAQNI